MIRIIRFIELSTLQITALIGDKKTQRSNTSISLYGTYFAVLTNNYMRDLVHPRGTCNEQKCFRGITIHKGGVMTLPGVAPMVRLDAQALEVFLKA